MANWRLARSLIKLREQINAASPNRSKISDGSVGDLRHSARVSDHNPNRAGVVCAIDVTHDLEHGVDGKVLSRWLTADVRTKYIIFAGEIWKARTRKWERYTGPNPHNHHVHVSVTPDGADDTSAWPGIDQESFFSKWEKVIKGIGKDQPATPITKPVLKRGDTGEWVKKLQTLLLIDADGIFGQNTEQFVRAFQEKNGLVVDGRVGSATWSALET